MPHPKQLAPLMAELESQALLRRRPEQSSREQMRQRFGEAWVDACSNDYLGLSGSLVSRETRGDSDPHLSTETARSVSRETLPQGAGASRLVHGTHPVHLSIEQFLAEGLGAEAAVLFPSGYTANLGALGALLGPDDHVVSDQLNHASLIDGMRLGRARVSVFPHLNLEAARDQLAEACAGAKFLVLESYYSMDGDGPDLSAWRALAEESGAALYLDEAHSFGLFGPEGRGLCAAAGFLPEVLMLAFGKAVGSQGAAVLGSRDLGTWLWNRARSFVFSTGVSPRHAAHLEEQLTRTRAAEGARQRVLESAARVRAAFASQGLPLVPGSFGPIISLLLGTPQRALALAERLQGQGILVQAIRPPTVPAEACRLRLTVSAAHSEAQLELLRNGVLEAFSAIG